MKHSLLCGIALLCLGISNVFAQDEVKDNKPSRKLFDHRIGVQANELVRQVFNFNNSAGSSINNPYLLTYSITWAKPGIGLRFGVGPQFNSFSNDDGIVQTENNINRMSLRAGIQKVFTLSDRWTAGAGGDAVYFNDRSYTKTFTRSFDSTKTDIATEVKTFGYGGMAWLRYHITPRIHIGTEASFYYSTGDNKQRIIIETRDNNTFPGSRRKTTVSELKDKRKEGVFHLPMVIYLVVKF